MKTPPSANIGTRILAATNLRTPKRRVLTAAQLGACMRRRDDPNP